MINAQCLLRVESYNSTEIGVNHSFCQCLTRLFHTLVLIRESLCVKSQGACTNHQVFALHRSAPIFFVWGELKTDQLCFPSHSFHLWAGTDFLFPIQTNWASPSNLASFVQILFPSTSPFGLIKHWLLSNLAFLLIWCQLCLWDCLFCPWGLLWQLVSVWSFFSDP